MKLMKVAEAPRRTGRRQKESTARLSICLLERRRTRTTKKAIEQGRNQCDRVPPQTQGSSKEKEQEGLLEKERKERKEEEEVANRAADRRGLKSSQQVPISGCLPCTPSASKRNRNRRDGRRREQGISANNGQQIAGKMLGRVEHRLDWPCARGWTAQTERFCPFSLLRRTKRGDEREDANFFQPGFYLWRQTRHIRPLNAVHRLRPLQLALRTVELDGRETDDQP